MILLALEQHTMHKRAIWAILTLLVIFTVAHPLRGEEYIEDLINIEEIDGKVIVIRSGKKPVSFNLRSKEEVFWSGAKGYIGAVLTKNRFLVVSTSSTVTQELSLRSEEASQSVVSLSPNLALLVTRERAIVFDRMANRFIESHLPVRDKFIAADANKNLAVVITSGRVLGLAFGSSTFNSMRLRTGEIVESLKLIVGVATIRTSDRLLEFQAANSSWHEQRF